MSLHPDPSACACNIQRERFTTLNYWQTNPSVGGGRRACCTTAAAAPRAAQLRPCSGTLVDTPFCSITFKRDLKWRHRRPAWVSGLGEIGSPHSSYGATIRCGQRTPCTTSPTTHTVGELRSLASVGLAASRRDSHTLLPPHNLATPETWLPSLRASEFWRCPAPGARSPRPRVHRLEPLAARLLASRISHSSAPSQRAGRGRAAPGPLRRMSRQTPTPHRLPPAVSGPSCRPR